MRVIGERDDGAAVVRILSEPQADTEIPFVINGEHDVTRSPVVFEPHTHPVHELVWVTRGVMDVRIGAQRWSLPNQSGLWIPAGIRHGGRLSAAATFHAAYFAPTTSLFRPEQPLNIDISPLLHELLLFLSAGPGDVLTDDIRADTERLVFALLSAAQDHPGLPLGEDPRIARITETLLERPGDDLSLQQWAAELGCSARTLSRIFRSETGHSFAQWKRILRIQAAQALLSSGASVATTATAVGFHKVSSFIAVFAGATGMTPGQFRSREALRDHPS